VTAAAVSFVGVIGFVGLVVPHILRIVLGPDNKVLLPASLLGGAAFLMMCDYISRVIAPNIGILPVGIVTSLVGAPYFIYLLRRRRTEMGWD
jgi:iron complex transport system permease protein